MVTHWRAKTLKATKNFRGSNYMLILTRSQRLWSAADKEVGS